MITEVQIVEACHAVARPEQWEPFHRLIRNPKAYKAVCDYLVRTDGYVGLVLRSSPFRGDYTDPNWFEQLTLAPAIHPYFNEFHVDTWLGTNVNYVKDRETRKGKTLLRVYRAVDAVSMLELVGSLDGWRPSIPDDLFGLNSLCELLFFVNSHEGEFHVRRNSMLSHDLCTLSKTSLKGDGGN